MSDLRRLVVETPAPTSLSRAAASSPCDLRRLVVETASCSYLMLHRGPATMRPPPHCSGDGVHPRTLMRWAARHWSNLDTALYVEAK